jgi:hypothetical protein
MKKLSFWRVFMRVVDWRFSGVFRKFRCANVVFLHGIRGGGVGENAV